MFFKTLSAFLQPKDPFWGYIHKIKMIWNSMNYIKSEVLSQFLIFIRAWPTLLAKQSPEEKPMEI